MAPLLPPSLRQSVLQTIRRLIPRPSTRMSFTRGRATLMGLRPYSTPQYYNPEPTRNLLKLIIFLNGGVFLGWQLAQNPNSPLSRKERLRLLMWLARNFTFNGQRSFDGGYYHTMVTCAFSHMGFAHILFNMTTLWAFGQTLAYIGIGPGHTIALSIGSAISGSVGSYLHEQTSREQRTYLGSSALVMGLGSAAACLVPHQKLLLFAVIPVRLWVLCGGYFVFDAYMLNARDTIGHSGHLGGALFGFAYYLVALRKFGGLSQMLRRLRR